MTWTKPKISDVAVECREDVLGEIPYRYDQRAPRTVDDPGVVAPHVGDLCGDPEALIMDLPYAGLVRSEEVQQIRNSILRHIRRGRRIPGLQAVHPPVVREEDLARMESCCRCRVVRDVRRIPGIVGDQSHPVLPPTAVSTSSCTSRESGSGSWRDVKASSPAGIEAPSRNLRERLPIRAPTNGKFLISSKPGG